MKAALAHVSRERPEFSWSVAVCVLVVGMAAVIVTPSGARAAELPVSLGVASDFAVLAGTTVTNTGASFITGDLGVSPGTAVTGFPPGTLIGAQHSADAAALQAQSDLTAAYDDAAGRTPATSVSGDLVGQTLTPGVYRSTSALGLTGTLTLDAQGDPSAVFVLQIASTLITGSASHVDLTGGAQASNVFWQVGSSATLGTASTFAGTILALTSITVTTDATIDGRALARNGAVTLDTNTITAAVGVLSITAPAGADLGTTVPGGAVNAGLGTVRVTDQRAGLAVGWTATVSATDFTTSAGTAAGTIPVDNARYSINGFATTAGSATFTPTPLTDLSVAAQAVVTATDVDGDNSVTWNPTIRVSVPAGAVAGHYLATITHSVA